MEENDDIQQGEAVPAPENDSGEESAEAAMTYEEVASPEEEAHAAALSIEVRALDGAEFEAAPEGADAIPPVSSDPVPAFAGGDALVPPSKRFRKGEWEHEFSGHQIAVELSRIESEVRKLLDERDPRRKRKITGTRRWQELEEDVIAMKFTGRIDENVLREITRLVSYRHFLFGQLRFVASTRSTWNT